MTPILKSTIAALLVIAGAPAVVIGQAATDRSRAMPVATCLVVTPDRNELVVGSQAGVVGRSFNQTKRWSISTQLEHVNSCAFSPDNKVLAVAGGTPAVNGIVEIWSWPERKRLGHLEGHSDIINSIVWLRAGKLLATASVDRTLRIWDVESRRCIATLTGHSAPVLALTVSPDGKWLCSGGVDQTIRLWDVSDWKLKRTLNNHLGSVHHLAFRPPSDGKQVCLASASEDGTVRIWYPLIGRLVRIVRHRVPVHCLAWNHEGTKLYSGAADGAVRLMSGEYHRITETRKVTGGWVVSLAARDSGEVIAGTTKGSVEMIGQE